MTITLEYLKKFSKSHQLMMIGAELERARVWQRKDEENFKGAISRALELIDIMLHDMRWLGQIAMLLGLRNELSSYYIGDKQSDISKLYQAL
ncbi:MAG: hypothetical protein Q8L47_01105 [bacterium]|nr:hypothetical protein [bacterium]